MATNNSTERTTTSTDTFACIFHFLEYYLYKIWIFLQRWWNNLSVFLLLPKTWTITASSTISRRLIWVNKSSCVNLVNISFKRYILMMLICFTYICQRYPPFLRLWIEFYFFSNSWHMATPAIQQLCQ